jgi:hypothetical protein|eukprot:COSAG01_NODE_3446_length_6086_cov_13.460999_1_plen_108_part_00
MWKRLVLVPAPITPTRSNGCCFGCCCRAASPVAAVLSVAAMMTSTATSISSSAQTVRGRGRVDADAWTQTACGARPPRTSSQCQPWLGGHRSNAVSALAQPVRVMAA